MSLQTGPIDESPCREMAQIVTRDNPRHVGIALLEVLDRDDPLRNQLGRESVRPRLHRFWPRELVLSTAHSDSAFAETIRATEDAFPEVVDWAMAI